MASEEKRIRAIEAMASVIREKSQASGVLVILDYGSEGTQIGSSNIEKEQAIKLLKYWSDELIKERELPDF